MVGTHLPEPRDSFQSAMQRMREAFEALRDGSLDPAVAEDQFRAGYDDALDLAFPLFLTGAPATRSERR